MARYIRIIGPAASFLTPIASTIVPGFTITRIFGVGPVLVLCSFSAVDVGGISSRCVSNDLHVDGVLVTADINIFCLQVASGISGGFKHLLPPMPGLHTLDWRTRNNGEQETQITAGQAELTIIELPHWAPDTELITL